MNNRSLAGALLGLGLAASAQGAIDRDPLSFLASGETTAATAIDGYTRYEPGSREPESGAAPIITQERIRGRFRILNNEKDALSLQQSAGHFNLTESPTVPQTDLHLPDSLWDFETGASYNHRLGEHRGWGTMLSVGSASDKPYNSIHELTVRVNANYRLPASGQNAWLLFLAYSNNRHFLNNVPMPGFAYLWNHPAEHWTAIAGFPFLAFWYRPDPWSLRASIFGPRNASVEAARRISGPVRAFTSFDWGQDEWLRAGRNDNSNRLIFDEKRATVGLRSPLFKRLDGELAGGWAFDRRYFENRSSSMKDVPFASLRNSWFFEARLTWRVSASKLPAP